MILTPTLRSTAPSALAWGGFVATFSGVIGGSFARLVSMPAERAGFKTMLAGMSAQTTAVLPPVRDAGTLGGYAWWFLFGFMPLTLGAWALLAGTAASRGDDERGLLEQWIGAAVPRWRIVVEQTTAFAVAAGGALILISIPLVVASQVSGAGLSLGGLALQCVNALAMLLVLYGLGALAGHLLPTRRVATGTAALVSLALFLLNGFGRTLHWLDGARWISPFYYWDRSDPMVPGGAMVYPALGALTGILVVLIALSVWAFTRRDLRDVPFRVMTAWRTRTVLRIQSSNPLLRSPALAGLWSQRTGIVIWGIGIGLYAGLDISIVKPMVAVFRSPHAGVLSMQGKLVFGFGKADPYAGFIGQGWFPVACLLLGVHAATQVSRWASDDTEGRLEMTLAASVSRTRVITQRLSTLLAASLVLVAANHVAVLIAAASQGISLDGGRLLQSSALVLPFAMACGGAGAAVAAWRPRIAIGVLIALLLGSYLLTLMAGPMFAPNLPPDWFMNLSVFKLYGVPLTDGPYWGGLWATLAIAVAGFAAAVLALNRRDVGR